jgi:hypothetical protein
MQFAFVACPSRIGNVATGLIALPDQKLALLLAPAKQWRDKCI